MSYQADFVSEGCSSAHSAVTLGVSIKRIAIHILSEQDLQAGVQWAEAYEFADAHNITLVGGILGALLHKQSL